MTTFSFALLVGLGIIVALALLAVGLVLMTNAVMGGMKQFVEKETAAKKEAFAFARASDICGDGSPFIELPGFLTPAECDAIISAAKHKGMHSSTVDGARTPDLSVRNSTLAWLRAETEPAALALVAKAERFAEGLRGANPACFGGDRGRPAPSRSAGDLEDIQVVRYAPGGKYEPHYDAKECDGKGLPACVPGRHRIANLLVYLNDGFGGGQTVFPRIDGGKSIVPEKGKAVFFWVSDAESARVYNETLHGDQPLVGVGAEKWIATQWFLAAA